MNNREYEIRMIAADVLMVFLREGIDKEDFSDVFGVLKSMFGFIDYSKLGKLRNIKEVAERCYWVLDDADINSEEINSLEKMVSDRSQKAESYCLADRGGENGEGWKKLGYDTNLRITQKIWLSPQKKRCLLYFLWLEGILRDDGSISISALLNLSDEKKKQGFGNLFSNLDGMVYLNDRVYLTKEEGEEIVTILDLRNKEMDDSARIRTGLSIYDILLFLIKKGEIRPADQV